MFEQKAASVEKSQTDKISEKSSAIYSWESENYKNRTEAGLLITSDGKKIDFGGTDHHVIGRADDIKLMDGAVFTHNHPTDNTFSQNDIVTGIVKGNLKELRAVTSTGDVHILVNNGATEEQRKKFSAAYQQRRMKAANAADSKIRKGQRINKDKYIKSRLEAFMSENAENYNLTYVKSNIEKHGKILANSEENGIIKTPRPRLKINIQLFAEKDLNKQSTKSIKKGIKSLEERIRLHNDKINNPSKYIHNYDSLDERYKSGIIRHWKKEIEDFTESINNRVEELKKRGDI